MRYTETDLAKITARVKSVEAEIVQVRIPKGRGRVRQKGMNGLETAYDNLLQLQLKAGELIWYSYEALKFRLADSTFYTPDFIIMRKTLCIEVHEVKGHWEDDARVKIKVAAEHFPFRFVGVTRSKGEWHYEEI